MSPAGEKVARHGVLPEGKVIGGRYRIGPVIGEGAQSVVYAATREVEKKKDGDPPSSHVRSADAPATPGTPTVPPGAEVALKVIHRHLCGDPQISGRFQREAAILRRLEGEHVVRLLDFVEDEGLLAIAVERVDGASLEALLAERGALDAGVAIEIALQICAALGAAHANGIVHRDLKPANVLIEKARVSAAGGTGIRVKVVDFGLGKVLQGDTNLALTEQGMIFGTAEYMAPEQARGDEVDARADLYAAGVILYEMLVGAPPFRGKTPVDTMSAHLVEPPPSPRAARAARGGGSPPTPPGAPISPALDAVILRTLSKDPADRPATARELAEAIAAARDEPRVFAPHAVTNPSEIAAGDTDLNLDAPVSLAHGRTLRADEIEAMKNEVPAARINTPPSPPSAPTQPPSTLLSAGQHKPTTGSRKVPILRPEILDEDTAVSAEEPKRSRWIWAVVAIVAAAVGVVIGVIVGTR